MKSYGTIFQPTGFVALTNSLSIYVQVNGAGDAIRYMSSIFYKEGVKQYKKCEVSKWQEIKYNKDGMPYFRMGNTRILLETVFKI